MVGLKGSVVAAGIATALSLMLASSVMGFGTFRAVKTTTLPGYVYGLAVADMNRNGKPDVIAGNGEGSDDHISLLRGRGDGTFKPERRIEDANAPEGIAVDRFNADRRKDFATANYTVSSVEVSTSS